MDVASNALPTGTQAGERHPLVTVPAVPFLKKKHQAVLLGCFAPVFLAMAIAILGSIIQQRKIRRTRRSGKSNTVAQSGGPRPYTSNYAPLILRWQSITLLLGFTVTAIGLLELSCHVLPAKSFRKAVQGFTSSSKSPEAAIHTPLLPKKQAEDADGGDSSPWTPTFNAPGIFEPEKECEQTVEITTPTPSPSVARETEIQTECEILTSSSVFHHSE